MFKNVSKVQMVLHGILEKFKTGEVPKAVTYALFPIQGIPSARWSFLNRTFMFLYGTCDARGVKQWNKVGRKVKKGSKAIYILVPYFIKKKNQDQEELEMLRGFLAKPVFAVEDTEGEPLDYQKEITLPDLPFIEKAKQWGISVSAIPSFTPFYGVYISGQKEIVLATSEETVFFHELAHAAYDLSIGRLRPGQNWDQEITAELTAQVLCHLVGKEPQRTLGNSYSYIESYAREAGLKPITACLKVIDDVEKVLNFILEKEGNDHVEYTVYGKTEQDTQAL